MGAKSRSNYALIFNKKSYSTMEKYLADCHKEMFDRALKKVVERFIAEENNSVKMPDLTTNLPTSENKA